MLIHHFIERSATRLPDKIALICEEERWSYRQLNQAADRLADYFLENGLHYGDRVILFMRNTAEAVISIFGTLKAGGIFVIVNPKIKHSKLKYIINDTKCRFIITEKQSINLVSETIKEESSVENVVCCGIKNNNIDSILYGCGNNFKVCNWKTILLENIDKADRCSERTIDIDLSTIIYTSGSTGVPKGVMAAHRNMVSVVKSIISYLDNVENDVILNVLPLSFDYGLYQILMAMYFGGTVVLEKSFSYLYQTLNKIRKEGVTGFPLVPTIANMMFKMKNIATFDFGTLRYITNTGDRLSERNIVNLKKIIPHAKIYSMYGLTECKRVSYLPPDDIVRKPGSVGIPIPNEQVMILDENGEELGPNEVGELVVRGANVMQGYWNDAEETARVFRAGRYDGDRLLHTGDLFKKDNDGYLYFICRKDDLIKTKGERVSPKEVEKVVSEINGVVEVAVIGTPDEIAGHVLTAYVVINDEHNLTTEKIFSTCKKQLELKNIPKYINFVRCIPKLPNGKIDKEALGKIV